MTSDPQHVADAVQRFGYTEREARFLGLVIAFSGHFLRPQYQRFAAVRKPGRTSQALLDKLLANGHADAYQWRTKTTVAHRFHVKHKGLYRCFGRPNSNHRKAAQNQLIETRIAALDYIVRHPEIRFFADETARVEHCREVHGITDPALLPHRIYGLPSGQRQATTVYFPDRFPMGVLEDGTLVLTYVDHPNETVRAFRGHLTRYASFLAAVRPPSRFVCITARPGRVPDLKRTFDSFFTTGGPSRSESEDPRFLRYCELANRWDARRRGGRPLKKADLDELQRLRKTYASEHFDALRQRLADQPAPTPTAPTAQHAPSHTPVFEPFSSPALCR